MAVRAKGEREESNLFATPKRNYIRNIIVASKAAPSGKKIPLYQFAHSRAIGRRRSRKALDPPIFFSLAAFSPELSHPSFVFFRKINKHRAPCYKEKRSSDMTTNFISYQKK